MIMHEKTKMKNGINNYNKKYAVIHFKQTFISILTLCVNYVFSNTTIRR